MRSLRKIIIAAIAIILMCSLSLKERTYAEDDVISGSCGPNATYLLDQSSGILTISGTGDIADYSSDSSVPWYQYRGSIKKVIVSSGITGLGEYAFCNCSSLTAVIIPASVTSIGGHAFNKCTSLSSITIPDSVISIGDYAFCDCTRLASITIPDSVTSIGDSAFFNCTGLTELTMPISVSVSQNMFSNVNNLSIVHLTKGTGAGANYNYSTCAYTPWYKSQCQVELSEGITSIGIFAFSNCKGLTLITIPDSVTSIGNYAFYECTGLISVTIGNSVTSIGNNTFYHCTGLTSVLIGNSVTSIGWYAFSECTGLTSITIPNSVTSIGHYAFGDVPVVTVYCNNQLISNSNKYGAKTIRITHYVDEGIVVEPTCMTEGSITGTCSVCGATDVSEIIVNLSNHSWDSTSLKYEWSDDFSSVLAFVHCTYNYDHMLSETVESEKVIIIPTSCETSGLTQYIATFTNELFETQIKFVDTPPLGHDYQLIEWHWNGCENASADFVCQNDNTHTVTETATITSEVTVPPTCESGGVKLYTATITLNDKTYNDTKTEELQALGHDYQFSGFEWDSEYNAKAVYICANDHNLDHIQRFDAEVSRTVVTAPTCEETGLRTHTAVYDGHTETVDEVLPAIGHNYVNPTYAWTDDYEHCIATAICSNDHEHVLTEEVESTYTTTATCTEAGITTYTAVFTNPLFEEVTIDVPTEALGHDFYVYEWRWNNYDSAMAIIMCHRSLTHTAAVPATITSEIIDSTCEEDGRTVYTATVTYEGKTYTDVKEITIPALGHDWQFDHFEWTEYTAKAVYVCAHDESHVTTADAQITSEVTTEPGCLSTGIRTYTASYDGHTDTKEEEIPALGHAWGDWEVTTPASCEEPGIETRECSRCHETENRDVPALGHDYQFSKFEWIEYTAKAVYVCAHDESHVITFVAEVTGEVTTEPRCESTGIRTYTASYDGHTDTKEEVIPALGHLWSEWAEKNPATCEGEGLETRDCLRCYKSEDRAIPALGHDYRFSQFAWTQYTARAVYVCTHDESHVITFAAEVTSEVTLEPGCESIGIRTYTASYDGHTGTKDEAIPALGHQWGEPSIQWWDPPAGQQYPAIAQATRICQRDSDHSETVSCNITVVEQTDTYIILNATATFRDGTTFSENRRFELIYLQLTEMSTDGITLSWNDIGAEKYELFKEGWASTTVFGTSYLDKVGRTMGTEYTYMLKAYKDGKWTEYSNALTIVYNPFSDVPNDSVSFNHVAWAYNHSVVNGLSSDHTLFGLNNRCTRVQFCYMLWNMNGKPSTAGMECPFSDLTGLSSNNKKAVIWCYNQKIVNGTSATTFAPGGDITRAQLAIMVWKMAGQPKTTGLSCPYTDLGSLSANNQKAVIWCYNNHLIDSITGTSFSPKSKGTRALLVEMLYGYNQIYQIVND